MKRNLWLRAALPVAALVVSAPAWAQEPRITFPAEGQAVRGEISIRFEGIPEGGYGVVYLDPETTEGRSPLAATAEGTVTLNTFLPTINNIRLGDGPHKLRVVAVNAQGRRTGQSEVNFTIANATPDAEAPGQRLVHWSDRDRIANTVKRYRIYAISNATVEEPSSGGGGGPAGGGGAGEPQEDKGAILDYQISALVRRVVRDVAMVDGSANIRAVVDRAYEMKRETGQAGGGGGSSRRKKKRPAGTKPPWGPWAPARETGQYYVKMIQPTGEEINATRKAPSIALGDLLPSFPRADVRPGSTWETQMTMIAELAERSPLNIRNAPMTFTAIETVTTPAGFPRPCAKLESRFQLPPEQAKEQALKLAIVLEANGTESTASSAGAAGAAGAGAGAEEKEPPEVKNARVRVSRVLWFDIAGRQVLRSEDVVDTNFEIEEAAEEMGGPAMGGPGATPTEPTKVTYNQRITTWLDDNVPPPSDQFNAGAGTAHSRDSVPDVTIDRVNTPDQM